MTKTLFWRRVTSEKNIVYLPRYQCFGKGLGTIVEDEMFETRMITCCFPNDYQFKLRLFLSPLSKMSKMKTKCQIKMMLFLSAGVPYISTIIVTGGIVKNLRLELHLECVKLKTGIKYYKN